ncbi:DUF3288 family protein [Romeria aff. gracilis LEGE 07310]|uniref:DUF3288 family protein n=1 Tax=Vasconcelosia minhoensis LEGE 07310 TaxID=915328 RepID=A0A8J7AYE9_9CYAN|nr:DUF3288 family protein [Romeria gracilis]MBE9078552.1 DUF3288 family protein [Romeria aff. gracilis LEGE 07310]
MAEGKEQQHPQYKKDRDTANGLLAAEPTDFNRAELARMRIRYDGFPGARDIQADLDKVLERWNLTEAELFEQTRQIHQIQTIYKASRTKGEDWS